ncbi:MAG: colanic acid/amylovoran biosynthesis glycosyltransferase [Planctomycetota bacterium]|jgi:colanic acid/amylovoran biosynthesis glycosyltransferase
MPTPPIFTLLPMLPVVRQVDGKWLMTRQFLDGVLEYQRAWDGDLKVVMDPATSVAARYDSIEVGPKELPFEMIIEQHNSPRLAVHLRDSAVVLCGLSPRQAGVAELCNKLGVPSIYNSEYNLRTRRQWVVAEQNNPIRMAHRYLKEGRTETQYRKAVRAAVGLQANGTPTFDAYASLSRYPVLFFDNRMRSEMILTDEQLEARLRRLAPGRGLRLVFSGKLNRANGVMDLLSVARELIQQEIRFELTIIGEGPLEATLRKRIEQWELSRCVRVEATRDFHKHLLPRLKRDYDLFICCHKQGEPSCAYIEALGCGLPVVGYSNDALRGLMGMADAGRTVARNDSNRLSELVRELSWRPEIIGNWSRSAIRFAQDNTFEDTWQRRTDHIRMIAELGRRDPALQGVSASA